MSNSVLSKLPFDPVIILIATLILVVILLVMMLIIISSQRQLARRYKQFMRGRDGKTLEDAIADCFDDLEHHTTLLKKHDHLISLLNQNKTGAYCHTGVVHYDAFAEMGGKLSFALALLDDSNSGFVLNVMHNREGSFSYVKEIVNGESFVPLAEEEAEALEKAITNNSFLD